jgi:hypothetical protein
MAVTVTVCGTLQSLVVKVSVDGATVTCAAALIVMVTSAVGAASSTTV